MNFVLKSFQLLFAITLLLPFAAFAAHPMLTEDLDTQGTSKFQLDVNTEHGYQDGDGSQTHEYVSATTLYYGFREDADLLFTAQHTKQNILTDGVLDTSGKGFNDVALDVKWRFYEKDGVNYGIKPGITLPAGNKDKGLGTGKTTYSLVLLSAIESNAWLYNWHIGYKHNESPRVSWRLFGLS